MTSELIEICKRYKYISFDIFDTLIKRMTKKPKDVFDLVMVKYNELYGNSNSIKNFSAIRIDSEREARNRKQGEITLDNIYEIISEYANIEIVSKYKEIEILTELEVCIPNVKIKNAFDYCIESRKTVLITTDMYLPRDTIEKILNENGYFGYKQIYLSCDEKKTKADGSLYDLLIEDQGIEKSKLLHVGDNPKSDILRAKQKGIHVYHVNNRHEKYSYKLDINGNAYSIYKFCAVTNPYNDMFPEVGYKCFGPLLYGFISWIEANAKKNCYNQIYFLSRDGYIMQKVYEIIKDDQSPKSSYFYASRRALQVAAIHFNPDYEYVMEHMFIPRKVSLRWLLRRWGLNPDEYKSKFALAEEFQKEGIINNDRVKQIYDGLKMEIIRNSETEFKAFESYLDHNEFSGNVAIVDIGWYGNMQNSMMEMLTHINRDVKVAGYYLGIVPESDYQNKYNMSGFLFQKGKNEDLYPRFKYMSSMMELFFMAPHGSAKRYRQNEEEVWVELSDFEFENNKIQTKIEKLQNAALKFVVDYKEKYRQTCNEKEYLAPLFDKFTKPDLKTACVFGDLQIWDDKWITLAPKHPLYKWLLNPRDAVKRFVNVSWKMGYLKRNIKLAFPYDVVVYKSRELFRS